MLSLQLYSSDRSLFVEVENVDQWVTISFHHLRCKMLYLVHESKHRCYTQQIQTTQLRVGHMPDQQLRKSECELNREENWQNTKKRSLKYAENINNNNKKRCIIHTTLMKISNLNFKRIGRYPDKRSGQFLHYINAASASASTIYQWREIVSFS